MSVVKPSSLTETIALMASMSYLQKFILALARQNLSPSTTAMQCHLETGHTKMIPNFRNLFGV